MDGDDTPTQPVYPTQPPPGAVGSPPAAEPPAASPTASASPLARHSLAIAIVAAVLAVIVIAGGTAWGVSAAVAGAQVAQTATSAHAGGQAMTGGKHAGRKGLGAVGTITAMTGQTWTIDAVSGSSVTVRLGSNTAYGTKKAPATESSFSIGDRVGVVGTRSGDTVTATRVAHLAAGGRTAQPSPPATT
jgi:hypothetical protein